MSALVFNSRRAIFADRRVRFALAHAFDFATVNQTLLHGAYHRTRSIFDNSELGSRGVPQGRERALLEPFLGGLPPELFETPYRPPGGEGGIRANLRTAKRILAGAGWVVRDGALRRAEDGLRMAFEILLVDPANEKIALSFARNLRRLGVEARVRTVDTSQYQYRRNTYDFDMIVYRWGMSLSPGNEQAFYWGTQAAGQEGTRNYPGIRNPAVDKLIDLMTKARKREVFVDVVRAMDRVLLWGHYFVPLYYLQRRPGRLLEEVRQARGHPALRGGDRRLVGGPGDGGRQPVRGADPATPAATPPPPCRVVPPPAAGRRCCALPPRPHRR